MTLVLVARVDGPRGGVAQRAGLPVRAITTAALGLVALAAAARVALDAAGVLVGALQLVPTAILVLAVGALADAAVAAPAPAPGGDPPAEVAVAAARMLTAVPLRHVGLEVVLTGAGPLGRRVFRRRDRRPPEAVALALVGSAAETRFATAHPMLRPPPRRQAWPSAAAAPRGPAGGPRSPSRAARPARARSSSPSRAASDEALAADGGGQPASSERFAKSTK